VNLKPWFQLFRAQTAAATLLLLLAPFLNNFPLFSSTTLLLAILFVLIHYFSFGQNSLMDYAMMYDQKDVNKKHHPLISGAIKQSAAHNVIHWGLGILTVAAACITLLISPASALAIFFLIVWVAFGHAYNDGLSKESLFGFLAISLCITSSGAWGWLLSHNSLSILGLIYLGYIFFTILYQISWSGFVKEMQVGEKSNIIAKMGAHLDINWRGKKEFVPEGARFYAWFVKGVNLAFGWILLLLNFNLVRLVITVLLGTAIAFYLYKTTKQRPYDRAKELMQMSMMEILTIFLPIPLLLGPVEAAVLMLAGVVYFFAINKILWGTLYPRV
jgi:hypothetical protein